MELVARQLYIKEHLSQHKSAKYSESGLWVSPEQPWLAASPDGLVSCKCCGRGLLEIKCPSSRREETPLQLAMRGGYHLELNDSTPQLKSSSPWYTQIQAQLYICKCDFCDFVVFSGSKISVERIYFGESWIDVILPKIVAFYEKFVYPKFISIQ